MKKLILIIVGILTLFLVSIVYGALGTLDILTPRLYTTVTSTGVNVSAIFNQTSNGEDHWSLLVYNASSLTGSRDLLYIANITNATFWNKTLTLVDGDRHWIILNVTNVTGGPVESSERVVDVDEKFLTFQLGIYDTYNFTLREGSLNISGTLSARDLFVQNHTSGNSAICDGTNLGKIIFNSTTPGYFFGCTPDGWVNLTSVN